MILNVSGRTDIVAFYMDWFLNGIERGYFLVRNPFVKTLVHKINYENVDAIVFCTKNPSNLLENIERITKPFILHVTLTPYGKDIEPNVPNKHDTIEVIKKISEAIGKNKIFIRYDPIFLSEKYTIDYHIRAFNEIVSELEGYTKTIIVSFIDRYKNVEAHLDELCMKEFEESDYARIGEEFSRIAGDDGMSVQTCSEVRTLFEYGFVQGDCVTSELIESIAGKSINKKWTGRNNKNCHCIQMYDIGDYNSCKHLCKYCYANYDESMIISNVSKHDSESEILIGAVSKVDEIKEII